MPILLQTAPALQDFPTAQQQQQQQQYHQQQQQQQQKRHIYQQQSAGHSGPLLQQLQQGIGGARAPSTGGSMPPPPARPPAAHASLSAGTHHAPASQMALQSPAAGLLPKQVQQWQPPGPVAAQDAGWLRTLQESAARTVGAGPALFPGQQSVQAVQQQHLQQWQASSRQPQTRQEWVLAQQQQQQQQQQSGGETPAARADHVLLQQRQEPARLQQQARTRSEPRTTFMERSLQRSAAPGSGTGTTHGASPALPPGGGAPAVSPAATARRGEEPLLSGGGALERPGAPQSSLDTLQAMQPDPTRGWGSAQMWSQHMRNGVNSSSASYGASQLATEPALMHMPVHPGPAPSCDEQQAAVQRASGRSDPTVQWRQNPQLPAGRQDMTVPEPVDLSGIAAPQHHGSTAVSLQQQAIAAMQEAAQLQHCRSRESGGVKVVVQQPQLPGEVAALADAALVQGVPTSPPPWQTKPA